MTLPAEHPPARRYKEILAEVSEAAAALREDDRRRAAELGRRLVGLEAAMLKAGERAALTGLGVELAWEAALEALWVESWMKLRPRPGPDPTADPADLDALDAEVDRRSTELQDAAAKRWWRRTRR